MKKIFISIGFVGLIITLAMAASLSNSMGGNQAIHPTNKAETQKDSTLQEKFDALKVQDDCQFAEIQRLKKENESLRLQYQKPTNSESSQASQPEPSPQKKIYKNGETIHIGHFSYLIKNATWENSINHNDYRTIVPDARFVVIELIVRNDDAVPHPIPQFRLIDENKAIYEISDKCWLEDGFFKTFDKLNPGVHKLGSIAFDVPKNHTYALVLFSETLTSGTALVDIFNNLQQ